MMTDKLTTFAWRNSKRDQIVVISVTMLTFPTIWITLELPKKIINDAIQGTGFPRSFAGFEFSQLQYLFLLCGAYLCAIAFNNGLKFFLNFSRGIMGERQLRRMRFDLFNKVMARRLPKLKSTSPGEVVQMISAELAPIGDFIGAIFATPLLQGGSFLVFLGFIIVQNPFVGMAALSLYPVQAYLIPKLQARVVATITRRLVNLRAIAREIGESIDGATEVRALRTRRWHLALLSDGLYENYLIRRRIFILKNLIKFCNNVADHLTPFLIFVIGGYFVIRGELDVGALTAVLIAYKDLSSPWKELLAYYQDLSDMSSRYRSVMAQFADDEDEVAAVAPLQGADAIRLTGAQVEHVSGPFSCHAPLNAVTVVVGEDDPARVAVLQAMAGVLELDRGTWALADLAPLHAPVLITSEARSFNGTLRYNILHGLYAFPVAPATDPGAALRRREAAMTGGPADDVLDTWVDPTALGYADEAALEARLMELVRRLDLESDLYRIGMSSMIDPKARPDLAARVIALRQAITADAELAAQRDDFIDVWTPDAYNPHGTLGENLFFARPVVAKSGWAALAADRNVARALDEAGIAGVLLDIGLDICERLISLFEAVTDQSDIASRYGMFPKSETPKIAKIVEKARSKGVARLTQGEKSRMITVALEYSSARYRLRVMRQDGREAQVLAARARLRKVAQTDARLSTFDPAAYVTSFSLSENIFFGPVRTDRRDAWGPFADRIDDLATRQGLRDAIVNEGLLQPVGDGGVALNAMQRRKIALAGALLKRPGALVLDGVATTDSAPDTALRRLLRAELGHGALVFGATREDDFADIDHVIRLPDRGNPDLSEGPPRRAALATANS